MYYHASQIANIKILEPRVSNHNIPLVYFSTKRENVLVYLSNAIEKYCKETRFEYDGNWQKWGPYGFEPDGRLRLEEYYPNALEDTYKGVSGYIYYAENIGNVSENIKISNAFATSEKVIINECEYIEDAYAEIKSAEEKGLIKILRFEDMDEKKLAWIENTMKKEYEEAIEHPEYRHFLRGKFGVGEI